MSIVQISKIQVRGGNLVDIPQLSPAEFGWADDQRRLFIGNEDTRTGDPMPNNTEVLTVYSPIDGRNITGNLTAAGQDKYVQFNNSGRLAGSPSLTFDTEQDSVQGVTIVQGGTGYLQVPTLVFDITYGNGANFAPNYQSKGLNVPINGPIGPNISDYYTLVSGGHYAQAPNITVQNFMEVQPTTGAAGNLIPVTSTANLVPGLLVTGSFIPPATRIEAIDSANNKVIITTTVTGVGSADVTFTDDRGYYANFESVFEPTRVMFNSATVMVSDTSTLNVGVDNLLVTGGSSRQVLSTDGNAGLSWVSVEGLTAGGSNTQLQFNNAGGFGGIADVTFDSSSNVLLIGQSVQLKGSGPTSSGLWSFKYGNINLGSVSNLHISNGTSGQVLSTDGTGNLSWITVDGTQSDEIANGTSNVSIPTLNGNVVVNVGTATYEFSEFDLNVTTNPPASPSPSLSGFSTGNFNTGVTTKALTANGNVNLGNVGNVHITGGTAGQVLATDGTGNLSWISTAPGFTQPTLLWTYTLPSNPPTNDHADWIMYSTPIVSQLGTDKCISVQGRDWYLYNLKTSDGSLVWRRPFDTVLYGRPQAFQTGSATTQQYIIGCAAGIDGSPTTGDGELRCYDATNTLIWTYSSIWNRPAFTTGTVTTATTGTRTLIDSSKNWNTNSFQWYSGTPADNGVITITSGASAGQTRKITNIPNSTTLDWSNQGKGAGGAVLSLAIGDAYTITLPTDGTTTQDFRAFRQHVGQLVQESGTWYLYTSCFDGCITKLNAVTGAVIWEQVVRGDMEPWPIIVDDGTGTTAVFVATGDQGIYPTPITDSGRSVCRLNKDTGAIEWGFFADYGCYTFLTAADIDGDGVVEILTGSESNRIYCFNSQTGALKWQTLDTGGSTAGWCLPVLQGDGSYNLFFASRTGWVFRIDPLTGVVIWRKQVNYGDGETGLINASPKSGDVNGDGLVEILFFDMADAITVMSQDGEIIGQHFVEEGIEGTPLLEDIDGDGKLEMVIPVLTGRIKYYRWS